MDFERLPGGPQFSRVFDEGAVLVGKYVVVHYRRRRSGVLRIGCAAGKKLGGAVVRNRLRRRLREALRTLCACGSAADVVLLARASTDSVEFTRLRREIYTLLKQAGVVGECPRSGEGTACHM